jgi:ferredoxin
MAFQVTLQPSGNRFECADNQEILKAGLAAGFLLPFSCRSGMCRSCRGTVLQGQVDFGTAHEKYLSVADRAKGLALLCCARPSSDLVIALDEVDPDRGSRPKRMPARVLSLERPIPSVSILTLGLPANEPMLFQAGQFLDVLLADGKRRSYSIANAPKAEGVRQRSVAALGLLVIAGPGAMRKERCVGQCTSLPQLLSTPNDTNPDTNRRIHDTNPSRIRHKPDTPQTFGPQNAPRHARSLE